MKHLKNIIIGIGNKISDFKQYIWLKRNAIKRDTLYDTTEIEKTLERNSKETDDLLKKYYNK